MSHQRDVRIDAVRGLALLMIFVDHIPRNWLGYVTLHNFSFSDAAEIFVLLAGVSSVLAYGRSFERDGLPAMVRKVALRCLRIYSYQAVLFLLTLGVVYLWTLHHQTRSARLSPIFDAPATGVFYGLTLRALPTYLDILPLYIVLLAVFPLIYLILRRSPIGVLLLSGSVWLFASQHSALDIPNWLDGKGWYFDPFAWQFLFVIGAVLSTVLAGCPNRLLPRRRWLTVIVVAYLVVVFFQSTPWQDWGLADLRLLPIPAPDKSVLAWPRIANILALTYLVFSSERVRRFAEHPRLSPVASLGRHSLEVFATSCVMALLSRLAFRTFDAGLPMQVAVNMIGVGTMFWVGWWLDYRRRTPADTRGTEPLIGPITAEPTVH